MRQWSEMPLWRTFRGVWQVSSVSAPGRAFDCRLPLRDGGRAWSCMQDTAVRAGGERAAEIGISLNVSSRSWRAWP